MDPPTIISFIADKVHDLCNKHDVRDRIPRWITEGELAINKKLAESIFLKVHDVELDRETLSRIWAYRKAALAVDKLPKSIA